MYSTWRKFDITQNNQPFDVVINVEDKTDHLKSTHLYPLFTKTFINFCPFPEPQLGNICVSINKLQMPQQKTTDNYAINF